MTVTESALIELATLARDTRSAQSAFFGIKTYPERSEALKAAKEFERRLDAAIAAILEGFDSISR